MTIVLVDDHVLLTESVKNILQALPDVEEVKLYNSGKAFVEDKIIVMPDIIITDLMMPGGINGMKLLEICREKYNGQAKMIVLTSINDVQTIKQAIRNGAMGFLPKACPIEELIDAIHEVKDGKQYIAKSLRDSLLNAVFTEEQVVYHLSPREKDVLNKVCSGLTIKEIAYDLKLSAHTVQFYHRSVMSKLKVKRTADLIVFAMQNGLYIPDVDAPK